MRRSAMSPCTPFLRETGRGRSDGLRLLMASLALVVGATALVHAQDRHLVLQYTVDLAGTGTDSLSVSLHVGGFPRDTACFQFAATVPGTYTVYNFGRYVGQLQAYDRQGQLLQVRHLTTNVFEIENARILDRVVYRVAPYASDAAGFLHDSIGAHLNGQSVCGFFRGFQKNPLSVSFATPPEWKVVTVLPFAGGAYHAESFDELVHSPFLLGRLTQAFFTVGATKYTVAVCSPGTGIQAGDLVDTVRSIVRAAQQFLGHPALSHYTILLHISAGNIFRALEHPHCFLCTLPEGEKWRTLRRFVFVLPHEYLHTLAPLHLHSGVIDEFDFMSPTPSLHLWLYEGITEWAAWTMMLRSGFVTESGFMGRLSDMLRQEAAYPRGVSLTEASLSCYDTSRQDWPMAYSRGLLVGVVLDFMLLDQAKGRRGLSDLLIELGRQYFPGRPFKEESFFDTLAAMTFPDIREFCRRYIEHAERLPMNEWLRRVGYSYDTLTSPGLSNTGQWTEDSNGVISSVPTDTVNARLGVRVGDLVLRFQYGKNVMPQDKDRISLRDSVRPGEPFSWIIRRDGKEVNLRAWAGQLPPVTRHLVSTQGHWLTQDQEEFRSWWRGHR